MEWRNITSVDGKINKSKRNWKSEERNVVGADALIHKVGSNIKIKQNHRWNHIRGTEVVYSIMLMFMVWKIIEDQKNDWYNYWALVA